ncbi:hypothetical protein MLD38_004308 [Melastoma candidum]|uniref:Uncharacterized protein n=1 Tax=Melastoma candidum TaxID=119954 RepID=A0ACB9S9Y5_9MYRT|nr:hypothetical protein MLD38_004308 [Melastoma candidum]
MQHLLMMDESTLIWYSGKEEKQLKFSQVLRIIPGQRTAIFQRYPRPEKEYQSFSLICNDRTLDMICNDKDEAEVWFVGLKALTSRGNFRKWRNDTANGSVSSGSPHGLLQRRSPSVVPFVSRTCLEILEYPDKLGLPLEYERMPQNPLAFTTMEERPPF